MVIPRTPLLSCDGVQRLFNWDLDQFGDVDRRPLCLLCPFISRRGIHSLVFTGLKLFELSRLRDRKSCPFNISCYVVVFPYLLSWHVIFGNFLGWYVQPSWISQIPMYRISFLMCLYVLLLTIFSIVSPMCRSIFPILVLPRVLTPKMS